jgi:NTE family protein
MIQNVYTDVQTKTRPIAYYSLGWKIENCIPGFINNMIDGHVAKEVIDAHEFKQDWIQDPESFRSDIQQYLENRLNYDKTQNRNLTEEEWEFARTTSTNLTKLSAKRVDCLIKHAENITELQVKLYCPVLIQ